jgi:hypothetical protein
MLQCDWCHKSIYGAAPRGWGYQVRFRPFHSLSLGQTPPSDGPAAIVLEAHLHPEPCKDEMAWAIRDLLAEREPLVTDGPDEDEEVEEVEAKETQEERRERRLRERLEKEAAWKRVPAAERDRILLEVLGEDRLTIRELTERMRSELPRCDLYESHVGRLVGRLFKEARELDRAADPRKKGRPRYLYFRRGLEGPIADLERTFHESDEGERS